MRTLRAYFLGRALREKLLLFAFIAIGLLWWLSSYTARASSFWGQQRKTRSQLAEQALWIKNRTRIEETARTAAAKLDPTKTLNAITLPTTLQQLANDAGLKNAQLSGTPVTNRSGQFALHTASFVIRGAEWEALVRFYEALQKHAPYIAVDQFNLSAVANNPAQLTLSLRAESVEIVQ